MNLWFKQVDGGSYLGLNDDPGLKRPPSVNLVIFARILFSCIALKDILATLKIRD